MAAMQLKDLIAKFGKKPKTVVLKASDEVTPALAILRDSPTKLMLQLAMNITNRNFTFKKIENDLYITSTAKTTDMAAPRRAQSKKARR